MKCLHCSVAFHPDGAQAAYAGAFYCEQLACPECRRPMLRVTHKGLNTTFFAYPQRVLRELLVSPEIPNKVNEDYLEAVNCLEISPKSSAALSRRCLQLILEDSCGVTKGNLSKQIDSYIQDKSPPDWLTADLHYLREIGNFSAHPQKDTQSKEILDVDPGEAEWSLEILEKMIKWVFIDPKEAEKRRIAFNDKLSSAGRELLATS